MWCLRVKITAHTCVCLVGFASYTSPQLKDMHWACTWGLAGLPSGIPPKPLLEQTLKLGHQLSSTLPLGALQLGKGRGQAVV